MDGLIKFTKDETKEWKFKISELNKEHIVYKESDICQDSLEKTFEDAKLYAKKRNIRNYTIRVYQRTRSSNEPWDKIIVLDDLM